MATTRRGSGEGGLYREERTRTTEQGPVTTVLWTATVEGGRDPITGKRRRVVVRAKTKAAAMAKVKQARQRLDAGVRDHPGLTVERLLEDWLNVVVSARAGSPNTISNYSQVVRLHLVPVLGRHKVRDLTPQHVDALLKAKADSGLSKNYVTRIRSVLADALTHAERRSLVGRNAARLAVMPKCKPTPEPRALTAVEAQAFIAAAQPHRLGPMLTTMVSVGLRPGEAAGLRWEDVDLDAGTLAVTGSMKRTDREGGGYDLVRGPVKKSTGGQRTIRLPRSLLPVLREQRRRQAAERLAAGPIWEDHGLVFASEAGTPLDPSNVRRAVTSVATAAGITWTVQPYTARHTAVSVLIDHGVPLEQVADLVGDDPRTVLLHYRHRVRPVVDAAAIGPFDDILETLALAQSEVRPAN